MIPEQLLLSHLAQAWGRGRGKVGTYTAWEGEQEGNRVVLITRNHSFLWSDWGRWPLLGGEYLLCVFCRSPQSSRETDSLFYLVL